MIINVPSAEGINRIALRLYSSAWTSLVKIYDDFDSAHEPEKGWSSNRPGGSWKNEWLEYVASCQPDLHAVCTVIQQSQELALKARVATISPYLLLVRTESRFSQAVKDIDFSTLRTLDAVDLPGAVNTLCKETLSASFMQTYERVRALRNQIAHLGAPSDDLQPLELLNILVEQFAEIWPDRRWLQERCEFAATSRLGFFHDGSNTSAEMEVMHEMPFILGMLSPAEFKRLFGQSKRAQCYLCPSCLYNAMTDYANLDLTKCTTAVLAADRQHVECLMCGRDFEVTEENCGTQDCAGKFQFLGDGQLQRSCLTCGE